MTHMASRNLSIVAWLIFTLAGLMVIGSSAFDQIACEGQPINNNVVPSFEQQIVGERIIGQSFIAPRAGLNRIDILFQTYGRTNTPDVTLRLLEVPAQVSNPFIEGLERFTTTFNAAAVRDQSWRTFTFPQISDSAGKTYLIVLQSPEADYGNAITVGGIEQDAYTKGSAFFGPISVAADITFRTCYTLSFNEKWSILAQQLTENKPSLWGDLRFYMALLGLYTFILIGVLAGLAKLAKQE